MKNLLLKTGKEESLLRFHPWVFSGAIQQPSESLEEGEIVRVLDAHGDFIAVGSQSVFCRSTMSQLTMNSGIPAFTRHWKCAVLSVLPIIPTTILIALSMAKET